ncbi:uncharacterized protein LOC117652697 [Thrips palmi]|uniref:Uncharacterized protein LOC117652697 n=1 Tax=Thrips palmi TaxID=161013 RepID=A0A6P9ACR7_THRPL|nr:uncharacterized protein LOC117652697 [Thrips palmi]
MHRRRLNDYRQYLEGKRDSAVPISNRTARAWLEQGKATATELVALGIYPVKAQQGRKNIKAVHLVLQPTLKSTCYTSTQLLPVAVTMTLRVELRLCMERLPLGLVVVILILFALT